MTRSDSPSSGKPEAEFDLDTERVGALLRAQHPDLAQLALQRAASGWDNVLYRLGRSLCVRLPRRALGARLLASEQDWLPQLAAQLPLPVPAPVRIGCPGEGFPWPWSIVPWFEGQTADQEPFSASAVEPWVAFLSALHRIALPPTATDAGSTLRPLPSNEFRGVPLAARAQMVEARLTRLAAATECVTAAVQLAWEAALSAPEAIVADWRWVHGDLHPRNVLCCAGLPCAVLDWGDLTVGDVATDLASIWMLFAQAEDRARALALYGVDVATVHRARGWAILFAAVLLDTGRPQGDAAGDPVQARSGALLFARVAEDVRSRPRGG